MPIPLPPKTTDQNIPQDKTSYQKTKSKIEILNDVRKLLEKNGLSINDDRLLALLDSLKVAGLSLSRYIELQSPKPITEAQEILVFPAGKHWIAHKNKYLEFNQKFFNSIAEAFDSDKLSKPFIDTDHEYKESLGDILSYRISPEGMYFEIKLNELGIRAVKDHRYKYISPAWGVVVDTEKKTHENCMATISFTNFPALLGTLPTLQEQIQLSRNGDKKKMELTRIAKLLELQAEASPEAIAMAIEAMKISVEQLTAALTELEGKAAEQDEVIDEQNRELTKIKQEKLEAEAEKVIKEAVELGQINPNEKLVTWKKKQYIEDPEKIKLELSMIPVQKKTPIDKTHTVKMDSELNLSQDEKDEIIELGYDLEKDKDLIIKSGYGKGGK